MCFGGSFLQPLLQCKSNEYYILWVCVCSMQCACALLSSVTCLTVPYFPINATILKKKKLNAKCVFWLSLRLLLETFLIVRRNKRDIAINVCWSSCKVPVILVRFWRDLHFLDRFWKNLQASNFMKIRPVGPEMLPCGRTDRLSRS